MSVKDTCRMTLPNSNELVTGSVKQEGDDYVCEFEKRAFTDISNKQHMFDGGVYRLEGVSSVGGKMVVTVHTPGEQAIVARGNRRGNTVQIRQKGELWIVLNL